MVNINNDTEYYEQFKKAPNKVVEAIDYHQAGELYKFSIIVPYRDNPYQDRERQLARFVPYMTDYLSQLGANYDFCIIVVEQSQDNRKFNRGQLLNIGFELARQQGCDYHIFHDVDLLPNNDLLGYYSLYPTLPLHLAAVWEKYQYLDLYFGGVCSFTTEQFTKLDGYPNNFWGWGGKTKNSTIALLKTA